MKRFYMVTAFFAGIFVLLFAPFMEPFRLPLVITVLLLYGFLLILGASRIESQFFVRALCRGDAAGNIVAITFDDGPYGKRSTEILEILSRHGCRASFFLIGRKAIDDPEIVKMMIEDGHLIGNHSFSHSNFFPLYSAARIKRELDETNRILEAAGSKPVRLFRPPFGVTNPNVARGVRTSGMKVAGWSIRSFDTRDQAADKVVKRILKRMRGGDVILLHETSKHILEILEQLIPAIQQAGLTCITLDQMFELNDKS